VAFLDITNAFPSTNRELLWVKLYEMGISGKLFDWMRMLYSRMEYVVTLNGAQSDVFYSDIGVEILYHRLFGTSSLQTSNSTLIQTI
jgi:hypothetical protein